MARQITDVQVKSVVAVFPASAVIPDHDRARLGSVRYIKIDVQ